MTTIIDANPTLFRFVAPVRCAGAAAAAAATAVARFGRREAVVERVEGGERIRLIVAVELTNERDDFRE